MNKEQIKSILKIQRGYLKKSPAFLMNKFNITDFNLIKDALKEVRQEVKEVHQKQNINRPVASNTVNSIEETVLYQKFLELSEELKKYKSKESSESKKATSKKRIEPYLKGDPNNVFIIGDLHAPFILDGYLEFCREIQEKYNCGTVISIGDIIDGHSWSYHEHDVDGLSVKQEVDNAVKQLEDWYYTFPNVVSLLGNHDLLISRKAKTAGLSQMFIRDFGDIIGAPKTWKFTHEYVKDNVKYIHGSIGNAITRAKNERVSICQGHLHSESFVQWSVSEKDAIFGLQVGCGLDREKYAFEYAKPFPRKPIISAGVILEKGTLPIVELMKL